MTALTRGPLPARVYWTRRLLLVGVVVGLVVGVVQLVQLAGGGNAPAEPDRAAPMAAEGGPTATPVTTPSEQDSRTRGGKEQGKGQGKGQKRKQKDKGPVLAEPEGPCADSDVAVTPTAGETVGGRPVTFVLELRTISSPACTWKVSPQTVTVKITSGKDDIWSSRECPRAIPTRNVVVRNNVGTEVEVTWSARRSEEGCTDLDEWAMPGWYHINAAALAGEPSDLQFELTRPKPDVITETVEPKPDNGRKDRKNDGKKRDRGRR